MDFFEKIIVILLQRSRFMVALERRYYTRNEVFLYGKFNR